MKRRLWIILGAGVVLLLAAAFFTTFQGGGGTLPTALLAGGGAAWTLAVVLSWRDLKRYLQRRSSRHGLNAFILSFLVVVILLLVGFVADRHSWRADFTANRQFTLSDKSLRVLQGIRKKIDVHVFFDRTSRDAVRDQLDEYTRRNRLVRVHIDDLNKDPEQAERYGVDNFGTIIFDAGDKIERIQSLGEEDITNALIKVSRPGKKKVYFVTDHGEKDITSKSISGFAAAAAALRRENYDPQLLSLQGRTEIPPDCDVLVVAGAKSRYLEGEIAAIRLYMQAGQRALFLFDPRFDCGLENYVGLWGVKVGEDRVVDPSPTGQLMGRGPLVPLVNRYGVHAITKQFKLPTYFESVRSVRPNNFYAGEAESAVLAFTGEQSWADGDVEGAKVQFGDPDDVAGPVPIAMAVRLDVKGKVREREPAVSFHNPNESAQQTEALQAAGAASGSEARLVVIGDSDFANNRNFPDMGNGNFFLNCIAWLAQDEDLIAVRPKDPDLRRVSLTKAELGAMNLIAMGVLPALVAGIGVFVTLRRSSRG